MPHQQSLGQLEFWQTPLATRHQEGELAIEGLLHLVPTPQIAQAEQEKNATGNIGGNLRAIEGQRSAAHEPVQNEFEPQNRKG